MKQLPELPRVPFLVLAAIFLQDMTNFLFGRKFVIGLGVLKGKGLAVFLTVRRLFRDDHSVVMDIRTFLDHGRVLSEADQRAVEKDGFTIPKHGNMRYDFHIPHWAFPKATLLILIAIREVAEMMMRSESAVDRVADAMRESGVAEEEVAKFVEKYSLKYPVASEEEDKKEHTVH